MSTPPPDRVSRADIEGKLSEIRGEVEAVGQSKKGLVVAAGAVAAVAVVALAYVLGRRKGKKKTTLVEVRRV